MKIQNNTRVGTVWVHYQRIGNCGSYAIPDIQLRNNFSVLNALPIHFSDQFSFFFSLCWSSHSTSISLFFTYLYVMFQSKLKHACRRCRLLKLRCDKAKPICLRCLRDDRQCGYTVSERPWLPIVQQRRRNSATSSEIPQHDSQIDPPRPLIPFWLPHNPSDTSNSRTDNRGISTVTRVSFPSLLIDRLHFGTWYGSKNMNNLPWPRHEIGFPTHVHAVAKKRFDVIDKRLARVALG